MDAQLLFGHRQLADLAFSAVRESQNPKCSWTTFTENISITDPEKTTAGYLTIISAPAHELDSTILSGEFYHTSSFIIM